MSGLLAIKGSLLAIGRRPGSTRGRHVAFSRCNPAVLRKRNLMRGFTRRTVVAGQLAVTQLGGLIASQRHQITSVRNFITSTRGRGAPLGAVQPLLRAAVASFAGRVVDLWVAAVQ